MHKVAATLHNAGFSFGFDTRSSDHTPCEM